MPALDKRDTTTRVSCPAANETLVQDSSKKFYEIQCKIDYPGNDFTWKNVNDFQACVDWCGQTNGCVGVAWVPQRNFPNCYLKNRMPASIKRADSWITDSEVHTAIFVPADQAPAKQCALTGWDCCPLPQGKLTVSSPDTVDAFTQNTAYASLASSATAPTGYVEVFKGLQGSTQQDNYRGYYLQDTYDISVCAARCSSDNDCKGFNIYIERDGTIRPANNVCPNPASTSLIKCVLWGSTLRSASASNVGQWQAQFQVAITASNGYNKEEVYSTAP
ncbi:hypothetical protein GTA08_BOTSDO06755 [Botryosphaeria dothidea]|uniref:Apple domain-containing protein n=1 Tax=Botryosphaeria dothidea TaxID=55169 RepID=A0A8H4ISA2_9PEZI|nr:hypothetical protein GTA08_BOTSDO06755 [Botryosphaeria dothidea]